MNLRRMIVLLLLSAGAFGNTLDDYTFLWWAHGWHYRSPEGRRILHVQTNHYGAAFDVEKPDLTRLGSIENASPYAEAVAQSNAAIADLPEATLTVRVTVDRVTYTCVSAAVGQDDSANFPVRIIESGRFLQRFDILNLEFRSAEGQRLDADARFEVLAWPDRLYALLDVTPASDMSNADLGVEIVARDGAHPATMSYPGPIAAGTSLTASLVWRAGSEADGADDGAAIAIGDVRGGGNLVPVGYDAAHGWYYVDLPERSWNVAEDPDRLDRFALRLANTSETSKAYRLLFAFDESFAGITGMCPMLRDAEGNPTGIPVQISKNWHRLPDRRFLYEGPWFHGVTIITVPPGETWNGELTIAYARWGGVPSASHAQLCLIGWGTNQLWDQAAIGSWGESICYDPDVNLNRSMIDDIRPLMVTGMSGGKWQWTHNVGGGDFLVYVDDKGVPQRLTRMRTAYLSQGPNLTDVVYAGISADGNIGARIEVSTPRCDDINRAYHRIRYDVLKPTPFSRLAFYQLGADLYNDHQFTTMARGNADGLLEEWPVERGGKRYSRRDIPCEGAAPWFSLRGGIRGEPWKEGAWADRGLVVRSWKARLAGRDLATPCAAVYGTENGVASANIELTPPSDLEQLDPGDFVEAELEVLIVPQSADDYYGPNEPLRADLKQHAGTWGVIHRLARDNDLRVEVQRGSPVRRLPVIVAADKDQRAEFTVRGGAGYVPIAITGLAAPRGHRLICDGIPLDQHVHGNDYWQSTYDTATKSYSLTYNVSLDPTDGAMTNVFSFGPAD